MISPRQVFEDTIRPAELLLRVYRLLENESVQRDGDLIKSLRTVVGATADEDLLLIYNEIFLGLIREKANLPASSLKQGALCNLMRQSVVVACTALETYLPSLLRVNLPTIIEARGRGFIPQDSEVQEHFKELTFDLPELLRILEDPNAPLYIANKILSLVSFKYLGGRKGVQIVGSLLAVEKPWEQIAVKLARERKELTRSVEETTKRRNDIVHRADRPQTDPGGKIQEISYSWSKQAVDTISHVCLALDELVAAKVVELKAETTQSVGQG
jgi:hypothetical protein